MELTSEKHNHKARQVHRSLTVTSPMMRGADIHELQEHCADVCTHFGFDWWIRKVDGQYGPQTGRWVRRCAWLLGLEIPGPLDSPLRHCNELIQHLIRNPKDRSREDRKREDERKAKRQRLKENHSRGPQQAVDWAMSKVGEHEVGSSNTGEFVSMVQKYFGMDGQPWCGCFAGYAVWKIGKGVDQWNYSTDPYFPHAGILGGQAQAGSRGLEQVSFDHLRPGDVLDLWGGEHEVLVRDYPKGDSIDTVEGNTSPTAGMGSEADGGAVAAKTRSRNDVSVCIRIEEW